MECLLKLSVKQADSVGSFAGQHPWHRAMGVIPLMPNPSARFTGRTEAIAKLKKHFLTNPDDVCSSEVKGLLILWNGGYWKDSDLLKVC